MAMIHRKLNRNGIASKATPAKGGKTADNTAVVFDLGNGLDLLNSVKECKKIDYTLPQQVVCLFDTREDGSRYNLRFVRSGLKIEDSEGKPHGLYLEVKPMVSEDKLNELKFQQEGKLTVRVADAPRIVELKPFLRDGVPTGDFQLHFVCVPEFVKFE